MKKTFIVILMVMIAKIAAAQAPHGGDLTFPNMKQNTPFTILLNEQFTGEIDSFSIDDGSTDADIVTAEINTSEPANPKVNCLTGTGPESHGETFFIIKAHGDAIAEKKVTVIVNEEPQANPHFVLSDSVTIIRPHELIVLNKTELFIDGDNEKLRLEIKQADTTHFKIKETRINYIFTAKPVQGTISTTIRIGADDPYGGYGALSFQAMIVNSPPTLNDGKSLPDIELVKNGPDSVLVLGHYFHDNDSDSLTYYVESSDVSVAVGNLAGDTLTITLTEPQEIGDSANLLIMIKDGMGGVAHHQLEVSALLPPGIKKNLPDSVFVTFGESHTIDMRDYFVCDIDSIYTFQPVSADTSVLRIQKNAQDKFLLELELVDSPEDTSKKHRPINVNLLINTNSIKCDSLGFCVLTNKAPRRENPIPGKIITYRNYERISLDTVFVDDESDDLMYKAWSDNDSIAMAKIRNDNELIVALTSATKSSETIIRVTAEDGYSLPVETWFVVRVENTPPEAEPISPVYLADDSLNSFKAIKLDTVFFDDDPGDSLTYTARCSDEVKLIATIENQKFLNIKLVSQKAFVTDKVSILVRASDGIASTPLLVDVIIDEAPQISGFKPDSNQKLFTSLTVNGTISDNKDQLKNVNLVFHKRGLKHKTTLTPTGKYSFTIPADSVSPRGIAYSIVATDNFDLKAEKFFIAHVFPEEYGVTSPTINSGQDISAYHLFSVPLRLYNKSPERVLADDLGPYNPKKWRFFSVDSGVSLKPYAPEDTTVFAPGRAHWLIIREGNKKIDTGAGEFLSALKPFEIELQPGWNYFGNPFNFNISHDNLKMKSNSPFDIYQFEGEWSDNQITHIEPFEGYAIISEKKGFDTLIIDPRESDSPTVTPEPESQEPVWSIDIAAICADSRDSHTHILISHAAERHLDSQDRPEPPHIGEYVSVSFPHLEWDAFLKKYAVDARPEPTNGDIWEFEVVTNINDKVHLTFTDIKDVPEHYEVWLFDRDLSLTQNLRDNQKYIVAGANVKQPKKLELAIGPSGYIEEQLEEIATIPTNYELHQNFPNPFNPSTTIRYGLPEDSDVTFTIYNILGEEVARLIDDEERAAGYHAVVWDGRNIFGRLVSNGVYVYRFQAGTRTMVKKMAFVK